MVERKDTASDEAFQGVRAPVVVIVGPTASGKSEVAQLVALTLGGEVISADSMQIYRGMDIGTAKLPLHERLVYHHLIDILDPGQAYSAQLFQQQARQCFSDIENRGLVPVLCGGTGLYVQAALEDMRFPSGEQVSNPIRQKYEAFAHDKGNQALWKLLNKRDPASAACIHPHNTRRVVRALEMAEEGVSYAEQVKNIRQLDEVIPSWRFYLKRDPKLLAQRINRRVDQMISAGLVDEVKGLLAEGFRSTLTAPQAIGYKEIVAYLDDRCSLEQAVESIKTATRRYAKRQRSWFKRDSRLIELDADVLTPGQIVDFICSTVHGAK